jgi:(2Fe-2S) ferredoxin
MGRPVRLVVCVNQRLGTGRRSCVGSGSLDLISRLETMLVEEKLPVPVVRRECLGHCEQGPVMRIAPAGPFFHEIDADTLDVIIAELKTFIASHHA